MKPKETSKNSIDAAIASLHTESDRGAAVLAGSLVENALGQVLEHHCLAYVSRKNVEKLFGSTGPISTFSQRTLVAAAFGLVDQIDHQQLNLIRDIRNHFAHHPLEASFQDAVVKEKTRLLRFHAVADTQPELQQQGSSRMAYLLTCSWLLGALRRGIDAAADD